MISILIKKINESFKTLSLPPQYNDINKINENNYKRLLRYLEELKNEHYYKGRNIKIKANDFFQEVIKAFKEADKHSKY